MSNTLPFPIFRDASHDDVASLHPLASDLLGTAANDSGTLRRPGYHVSDLNVLVAGVVGHVAGHIVPERVNITLRPAAGHPLVAGDPAELAFAISGIITTEVREVELADGGDVRVEVFSGSALARIVISSDNLPSLRRIRSVSSSIDPGPTDPTLSHCRRLIEAYGGRLALTEHDSRIAFEAAFPTVTLTSSVCMFRTRVARPPRSEALVCAA